MQRIRLASGLVTLYDVTEVAELLNLSRYTIHRYIRKGRLPAVKSGGHWLVSDTALFDFLHGKTVKQADTEAKSHKQKSDQWDYEELLRKAKNSPYGF